MQIDVKKLSDKILEEIKTDIETLISPLVPTFTVYAICNKDGEINKASLSYIKLKQQTAESVGIKCNIKIMKEEDFIMEMTRMEDFDESIRAILQLPAPDKCINRFEYNVKKERIIDVDYLDKQTLLNITEGNFKKIPCTPLGVISILEEEFSSLKDKRVALVGSRSKTVGIYLAYLLQELGAKVTLYNSRTSINKGEFAMTDIVISCVGKENLITKNHFSMLSNAVCIDIGVSFIDGKVNGDFSKSIRDIRNIRYTPYTNGVGLMTRTMLMRNVVDSYQF